MGVSRDCPIFRVPPIISGTAKAAIFKFCRHIHRLNRNKSPLKISRKAAMGIVRDSRKFSGHPYMAHRAVIFATAQLSCICIVWINFVIHSYTSINHWVKCKASKRKLKYLKISYTCIILSNMVSIQSFCHRPYNNLRTVRCGIPDFRYHGNKGQSMANFKFPAVENPLFGARFSTISQLLIFICSFFIFYLYFIFLYFVYVYAASCVFNQ